MLKQQELYNKKQSDSWTLFIDGASRNNPGPSAAGIYILKNDILFLQNGYYLGIKTNNQAEYLALIFGLIILSEHIHVQDHVKIISDSQLLVRQLMGIYKVKHINLQLLHMVCKKKITAMNAIISHVLRDQNIKADAMANQGLDNKIVPPKNYLEQLKQYGIFL